MIKEALTRRYYQWKVSRLPHETPETCYCGGQFKTLYEDGLLLPVPSMLECCACGVVTTARRLTADSVDRLYREGLYRKAMTGKSGVDLEHLQKEARRGRSIYSWLADHDYSLWERWVGDVGCGCGGALLAALTYGASEAWGYDMDERAVKVGQSLGLLAGTEWHPFKADILVMSHVLEHAYQPDVLLQQARENLYPDGRIVIEVPEFTKDTVPSPWHIHYFNEGSLRRLVALAGLRVDVIEPGIRAIVRRG